MTGAKVPMSVESELKRRVDEIEEKLSKMESVYGRLLSSSVRCEMMIDQLAERDKGLVDLGKQIQFLMGRLIKCQS